jgi:hypothetical protein
MEHAVMLRRCVVVVAAAVSLLAPPARAEDCRDFTWESVGEDFEALVKAPFEMDEEGWIKTSVAFAGVGATMIWADAPVDRMVMEQSPAWEPFHKLASISNWYGRNGKNAFVVSAGVIGAVALGGWIADEDRMVDTAGIMTESLVFSTAITGLSKVLFGRRRPHANEGPHRFNWFVGPGDHESDSFPSGHSSTAFSLAGAGAGRHPHWYVQIPAYTLAVSAGLQRIDARAHWTSDVITGALIGYAVSEFLVDRYDCNPDNSGDSPALSLSFGVSF